MFNGYLLIGHLNLQYQTPSDRTDLYHEAILKKLDFILDTASKGKLIPVFTGQFCSSFMDKRMLAPMFRLLYGKQCIIQVPQRDLTNGLLPDDHPLTLLSEAHIAQLILPGEIIHIDNIEHACNKISYISDKKQDHIPLEKKDQEETLFLLEHEWKVPVIKKHGLWVRPDLLHEACTYNRNQVILSPVGRSHPRFANTQPAVVSLTREISVINVPHEHRVFNEVNTPLPEAQDSQSFIKMMADQREQEQQREQDARKQLRRILDQTYQKLESSSAVVQIVDKLWLTTEPEEQMDDEMSDILNEMAY